MTAEVLKALRDAVVVASGLGDGEVIIEPFGGVRRELPYGSVEWISLEDPVPVTEEVTNTPDGDGFVRNRSYVGRGIVRVRIYGSTCLDLGQGMAERLGDDDVLAAMVAALPDGRLVIQDQGALTPMAAFRELAHERQVYLDLQISWISRRVDSVGRIERVIGEGAAAGVDVTI